MVFEFLEQVGTHFPVTADGLVPFANDLGAHRIEAGNAVKPANAGVEDKMRGGGVIPGDVRGQATHGKGPAKAAMNQQRTIFFQQVGQALQARSVMFGSQLVRNSLTHSWDSMVKLLFHQFKLAPQQAAYMVMTYLQST